MRRALLIVIWLLALWLDEGPLDGVSLMGCGIWWFFLPGVRTVNLPSGDCDTIIFTAENPVVDVEVPVELDFLVEEEVVLDVESEIDPETIIGDDPVVDVDCD